MGWATPSEAGAVGAFGATFLAVIGNKFTLPMLRSVIAFLWSYYFYGVYDYLKCNLFCICF